MFDFTVKRGKGEVRTLYYRKEKEDRSKEEICNITPLIHLSPRLDIP